MVGGPEGHDGDGKDAEGGPLSDTVNDAHIEKGIDAVDDSDNKGDKDDIPRSLLRVHERCGAGIQTHAGVAMRQRSLREVSIWSG